MISLVTDSTFLYFLQPIISDGVVATTFLLSLATARPMVARLAGDFYPMDHELSLRPAGPAPVLATSPCSGRCSASARPLMTLWLLQSQSLETFVLVKSVTVLAINVLAAVATVAAAAVVARQEGLLGPRPRRSRSRYASEAPAGHPESPPASRIPPRCRRTRFCGKVTSCRTPTNPPTGCSPRPSGATRAPASTTATRASRPGRRATWSGR